MNILLRAIFLLGLFAFSFYLLTVDKFVFQREQNSVNAIENQSIVKFAQERLSHSGILKENKGFIYLKVDDGYINELFPLLANSSYSKPFYFRRENAPGAHISVFYSEEKNRIGPIQEIGNSYSFKIINVIAVPPKTQEFIVLEVSSPELEQLRKKYGLSPFLKNHNFHITIAKKNL